MFIFQLATKRFITPLSFRGAKRRGISREVLHFRSGRSPSLRSGERLDAGKLSIGEELERGAAARRDVREPIGDPGLAHRGDALAASHDGHRIGIGEKERERAGAPVEGRLLEDAQRTVPEDRARWLEEALELLESLLSDIERHR